MSMSDFEVRLSAHAILLVALIDEIKKKDPDLTQGVLAALEKRISGMPLPNSLSDIVEEGGRIEHELEILASRLKA